MKLFLIAVTFPCITWILFRGCSWAFLTDRNNVIIIIFSEYKIISAIQKQVVNPHTFFSSVSRLGELYSEPYSERILNYRLVYVLWRRVLGMRQKDNGWCGTPEPCFPVNLSQLCIYCTVSQCKMSCKGIADLLIRNTRFTSLHSF